MKFYFSRVEIIQEQEFIQFIFHELGSFLVSVETNSTFLRECRFNFPGKRDVITCQHWRTRRIRESYPLISSVIIECIKDERRVRSNTCERLNSFLLRAQSSKRGKGTINLSSMHSLAHEWASRPTRCHLLVRDRLERHSIYFAFVILASLNAYI